MISMNGLLIISIAALDLLNVTTVISSGAMWNMKLLTNNQVRNELKKPFSVVVPLFQGVIFIDQ